MLPLEKQVLSLELSKRLVELGVVLDTIYSHHIFPYGTGETSGIYRTPPVELKEIVDYYPAPTVAELGVLLPDTTPNATRLFGVCTKKDTGHFITGVKFYSFRFGSDKYFPENRKISVCKESEADARGAALIWLIENGYLKKEEVKL